MRNALSLLLLAGALAAGPASAQRPVDERRPLAPDATVAVTNVAGRIEVEAWDRDELHLTGELGDDVEELEITGSERSLTIRVKVPTFARGVDDTVLHLRVPAGTALDLDAVSADVAVRGTRGAITVETVSGDVSVDGGAVRVEVQSVSGDLEIRSAARSTRAETVSGEIVLRGGSGEVRGESVSGEITVEGSGLADVELETVSGDVTVEGSLARDGRVGLSSLSGTLALRVPALPDGRIKLRTFSGDVHSDWPFSGGGKRYEHSTGSGSGRVELETFSGDVELTKR